MHDLATSAESVFRAIIENTADFAIFLVGADGRIESWNGGAENVFGYEASEVIGRPFDMLFTPEDRAAGAPAHELATAREKGRAEDTRWHLRKDGKRFFTDGSTTLIAEPDGGSIIGFAKIARDITVRFRSEQRLAAQLALTTILNVEEPFAVTTRRVLEAICTHLGWDLGILWTPTDGGALRAVQSWAANPTLAAAARELSSETLPAGVGLPGAVQASLEVRWIRDFSAEKAFPRAPAALTAGMRAAVAFPIAHDARVTAVMEFFSREVREPDLALLPVMSLVGGQIGDYLDSVRTTNLLRDAEMRHRIVLETAQDAIFTIDEDSRITYCNPAVERIFGYKPAELVGQTLDRVIPERFRAAHHRGVAHFLRTHERNIPWTGVSLPGLHRDGHEIAMEISFGAWKGENQTIFTGFARDVTDRMRALEEEQKARSEAEAARAQLERRADEESSFRHLASALNGAVEMIDVLYEITNRATLVTRADGVYVERIVGPQQVEVVSAAGRGTPQRGTRVSYPGSLTEEIMAQGQPVILADMRDFGSAMAPYLIKTCSQCEVLVAPLIAEEEPLGALVLLNSRGSGRRFGDADILRARTLGDLTSLALRRVRLMEQEREARAKAEAALRVRDETLGIVSHDLRNPLTKIALSAELIADAGEEEQRELLETIRISSKQAQRLIQDLLDVARVEAGRFAVQKSVIDGDALMALVCDSNTPLAAQRQQTIRCAVKGPLPRICGDRDRLLQVFANLVGNAMKFTPAGGEITIEARESGSDVVFQVTDTGPGIPETDLQSVFKPYWQAKKTAHMGAGLGLAIVRGIVEAHGGKVWAGNAPSGAQFTFTIPAA